MEGQKDSNLAITEKEREFPITIGNDCFTIQIPLPGDRATIIARIARALGGMDIKSYPPDDYEYVRMLITLNNTIVDSPKWWKGVETCASHELLQELWKHFLDSEIKFQEFLKKNNKQGTVR